MLRIYESIKILWDDKTDNEIDLVFASIAKYAKIQLT